MAKRSNLTKAIKETGRSPIELIPTLLGISYETFRYRIRTGHFHLQDIHTLTHFLGKSFEDLWPNPNKVHHQRIPIPLVVAEAPVMSQQPLTKKARVEKPQLPPRPPRIKEPVVFNDEPVPPLDVSPPKENRPKRVFKAVDVFDQSGGLPLPPADDLL